MGTSVSLLILLHITQFGAPHYRQRERASAALTKLLPLAHSYLEAGERSQDAEIAQRCRLLVDKYYQDTAEDKVQHSKPSHWPRMPWVDMVPSSYQGDYTHYLSRGQKKITAGMGQPEWEEYREGTRFLLRDLYAQRHTQAQVVEFLDAMVVNEIEWIKRFGKHYEPPITRPDKGAGPDL